MNAVPSTARTLLVAVAVALVCSLLVSTAVYLLRPMQLAYASLERNRVILLAAGLIDPAEDIPDREIVRRSLELDARVVDLEADWFASGIEPVVAEGIRDSLPKDPIPGSQDIAGLYERPRYVSVYLLIQEDRISRIVLPIYGSGMWAQIHGFICLESDFNTIAGVEFYRHGETPGIGDRIQDPEWRRGWQGKRLYDASGAMRFRIVEEGVGDDYRVDAISGASVTVSGVENIVRYWLGGHAFGPILARLREQGARVSAD